MMTGLTITATDRYNLPYEILNITYDKNSKAIIIEGWAYLTDTQHYKNAADHTTNIIVRADNHSLTYNAKIKPISLTDVEFYAGKRYCKQREFFKDSRECNYSYENVGFSVSIPLDDLKQNKKYQLTLEFIAHTANRKESIEIYYPIKKNLQFKDAQASVTVESSLYDVRLKVNYSDIYARNAPTKAGKIYISNPKCSTAYGGRSYFKQGALFSKVLDRKSQNNITYYKVSGSHHSCSQEGKNLVKEGNSIKPLWIASTFVDYQGKPLIINTVQKNIQPIIKADDVKLYQGDPFNPFEGVSAADVEDGDITKNVTIDYNDFQDRVGSYSIVYKVTDSFNATVAKKRFITVLRRNVAPIINATDKIIKQYSIFYPLKDVTAVDQDKADISGNLKTTSIVDTSLLKTQKQCYYVKDRYQLSTSKCINVYIEKANTTKRLRFIQKSQLFYKEPIPYNWTNYMNVMKEQLNNDIAITEL